MCELNISDGVKIIGKSAFSFALRISELIIPDSVTKIGELAFSCCGSNNYKFTSVVIPKSVTEIADGAFNYCKTLTKITIPRAFLGRVEKIFSNCQIKEIEIVD